MKVKIKVEIMEQLILILYHYQEIKNKNKVICLQGIDIYEITDELTDDSWTYDIGNFNPYRSEVTQLTVSISKTNQFFFIKCLNDI